MKNVSSHINSNSFCIDIAAHGLINNHLSYCIRNIYRNANHHLKNPISENAVMHVADPWLQESNFIHTIILALTTGISGLCSHSQDFPLSTPPPPT